MKIVRVAPALLEFVDIPRCRVGTDGGHQVAAESGRAAGRLFCPRANPQRHGLLDRLGAEAQVFDLGEAAVKADPVLGPDFLEQLDALAQTGRALLARHAQGVKLHIRVALADAKIEAAV